MVWIFGQTRIHLDEVDGLGAFLKLEIVLVDGQSDEEGNLIAAELVSLLRVQEKAIIGKAYIDLLIDGKSCIGVVFGRSFFDFLICLYRGRLKLV